MSMLLYSTYAGELSSVFKPVIMEQTRLLMSGQSHFEKKSPVNLPMDRRKLWLSRFQPDPIKKEKMTKLQWKMFIERPKQHNMQTVH